MEGVSDRAVAVGESLAAEARYQAQHLLRTWPGLATVGTRRKGAPFRFVDGVAVAPAKDEADRVPVSSAVRVQGEMVTGTARAGLRWFDVVWSDGRTSWEPESAVMGGRPELVRAYRQAERTKARVFKLQPVSTSTPPAAGVPTVILRIARDTDRGDESRQQPKKRRLPGKAEATEEQEVAQEGAWPREGAAARPEKAEAAEPPTDGDESDRTSSEYPEAESGNCSWDDDDMGPASVEVEDVEAELLGRGAGRCEGAENEGGGVPHIPQLEPVPVSERRTAATTAARAPRPDSVSDTDTDTDTDSAGPDPTPSRRNKKRRRSCARSVEFPAPTSPAVAVDGVAVEVERVPAAKRRRAGLPKYGDIKRDSVVFVLTRHSTRRSCFCEVELSTGDVVWVGEERLVRHCGDLLADCERRERGPDPVPRPVVAVRVKNEAGGTAAGSALSSSSSSPASAAVAGSSAAGGTPSRGICADVDVVSAPVRGGGGAGGEVTYGVPVLTAAQPTANAQGRTVSLDDVIRVAMTALWAGGVVSVATVDCLRRLGLRPDSTIACVRVLRDHGVLGLGDEMERVLLPDAAAVRERLAAGARGDYPVRHNSAFFDTHESAFDVDVDYEVEAILSRRRVVSPGGGAPVTEHLVKWVGYPLELSTWECTANTVGCVGVVHEFNARLEREAREAAAAAGARRSSPRRSRR